MKLVLSASGPTLESPLDPRFGRTPYLIVCDLDAETFEVLDNTGSQQAVQGAGIQTAKVVAQVGAGALVTGHCGPKAYRVLQAAGVQVFTSTAPTIADALQAYRSGSLQPLAGADVQGHWA